MHGFLFVCTWAKNTSGGGEGAFSSTTFLEIDASRILEKSCFDCGLNLICKKLKDAFCLCLCLNLFWFGANGTWTAYLRPRKIFVGCKLYNTREFFKSICSSSSLQDLCDFNRLYFAHMLCIINDQCRLSPVDPSEPPNVLCQRRHQTIKALFRWNSLLEKTQPTLHILKTECAIALCSREDVRTANIIACDPEGVDCLCLDRE